MSQRLLGVFRAMVLRAASGIDTLERGLKLPATSKSQEQLRNYAMQALRRTQQRLLLTVLERTKQTGDMSSVAQPFLPEA